MLTDPTADAAGTDRDDQGGYVEVIALRGIPEIQPGDDLAQILLAAMIRTPRVLPLRGDEVLVVTQKIVSKAEGAVVDLRTVEPGPEARAWAAAYGRDPRVVEVVLREARRIVRMERGVLITETPQGFICANGGIDASNVGARSGEAVTLLPADPDGSARRLREALSGQLGVDLPVIVSDSFGRPWRQGIVDVAIGVAGLRPLDDLRGQPDADGRIMRTTVRAVADEIAAAAELALGKTTRRPAAVVRGARAPRGEGQAREIVMPADQDLFR